LALADAGIPKRVLNEIGRLRKRAGKVQLYSVSGTFRPVNRAREDLDGQKSQLRLARTSVAGQGGDRSGSWRRRERGRRVGCGTMVIVGPPRLVCAASCAGTCRDHAGRSC
jgi:hypothetical protein